jgi:hypothetical protein
VTLLGPGDDEGGGLDRRRLRVGGVDRGDIVSVDLDRVPAVGSRSFGEQTGVPPVHRGATLAQPVHVEDRHDVVQLVEGCRFHRLPDGALRRLGVTHQHEDPGAAAVHAHRERHADADRETLSEGPGGDVDPRELGNGRGVSLDR